MHGFVEDGRLGQWVNPVDKLTKLTTNTNAEWIVRERRLIKTKQDADLKLYENNIIIIITTLLLFFFTFSIWISCNLTKVFKHTQLLFVFLLQENTEKNVLGLPQLITINC